MRIQIDVIETDKTGQFKPAFKIVTFDEQGNERLTLVCATKAYLVAEVAHAVAYHTEALSAEEGGLFIPK